MALEIVTVPCLTDNYAYLLHDPASGATAVVDVPEAGPIRAALAGRGWRLGRILITHHHADHIQGVEELRAATGAEVLGNAADAHRLPRLDRALRVGETVDLGEPVEVLEASGHTVGHVAYHAPASAAAFTADSLMVCGCGRVFEGTMPMMWATLERLAALPRATMIHSGHDYAAANLRFALTIEPRNEELKLRAAETERASAGGRPPVPALLALELATNPFLRPDSPAIRKLLGFDAEAENAEVFAEIRRRKDAF